MSGLRRSVRRPAALVCAAIITLALAAAVPGAASADNTLVYGGGLRGITGPGNNEVETGVMTKPITYLVFWGSQWGPEKTANGIVIFPQGDPAGAAPYVQNYLEGMGSQAPTSNGTWDGIVTQYCQGFYRAGVPEGVLRGQSSCPPGDPGDHVGYPTGGELAPSRVWYDGSAPVPGAATAEQIANEATAAAKHFRNTTEAQNLNAQYVIMSPTGTHPDNFFIPPPPSPKGFCGWHDYTLHYSVGIRTPNGGVTTPYGNLAFTNLPYVPDVKKSCFASALPGRDGPLQGLSIVESHEYAETVTDPEPNTAWNGGRGEIGDECAIGQKGFQGLAGRITYAKGSFVVQGQWSNSNNKCVLADPTVP